jgi:hypothetical protein
MQFVGSGRTEKNVLFSYHSNWDSPGRWGLEVMTAKHKLIFRPMEKLQAQKLGSFDIIPIEVDDSLDREIKPGVALQVESFIKSEGKKIPTLAEQVEMLSIFDQILTGRK